MKDVSKRYRTIGGATTFSGTRAREPELGPTFSFVAL